MGILNVTPDSFSDGSQLGQLDGSAFKVDVEKVLKRAESMVEAGALILDVGGESTRPGAQEVSPAEEIDRVIPIVELLQKNFDVCLSVDTSAPELLKEALNLNINLVNDIRAMTRSGTLQLLAESNAAVCLMHMQGQPRTMQKDYHYDDVVKDVMDFLHERVKDCEAAGVSRNRMLVDPGFGFGKSVNHNFRLLRHLDKFAELELPILAGLSRKSMLGAVTGKEVGEREAASVSAATLALQGGANIIRAHDVAATMDAIRVHCAYRNEE